MRTLTIFTLLINLSLASQGQVQKMIQRDWIKMSIENLSDRPIEPDTIFTRYSFGKSTLHISFYTGWNNYIQTWSVSSNNLQLTFDT